VRVRPPDPNMESDLHRGICLDVTSDTTLMVYSKPDPKVFTFDHVADKTATQVRDHVDFGYLKKCPDYKDVHISEAYIHTENVFVYSFRPRPLVHLSHR